MPKPTRVRSRLADAVDLLDSDIFREACSPANVILLRRERDALKADLVDALAREEEQRTLAEQRLALLERSDEDLDAPRLHLVEPDCEHEECHRPYWEG